MQIFSRGLMAIGVLAALAPPSFAFVQDQARGLTPLQLEISNQRLRLDSADVEDRRDALMRLRSLQHPDASRAAIPALSDASPMVRATAAATLRWLPLTELTGNLVPLLSDKDEFVRQQVSYALGQRGNETAVTALIERLSDKQDSVRGAAAVALGEIGDVNAVTALVAVLDPQPDVAAKKKKKVKKEPNALVLRAAVHSLGQIASRSASPLLITILQDEKAEPDVRREAAIALGQIRDETALAALRSVVTNGDPYLAQSAYDAIKRIQNRQ